MKKHLINFLLVIISCSVPLLLAEYIFKKGLFDKANKGFEKYRNQKLYTADWDEDFWKLYCMWGNEKVIGRNRITGWNYDTYFDSTFFHSDVPFIKKRRAAILYGDSFAQCVSGTEPFQKVINADTTFSKDYYLLNYGTGAFGVDQIYTLFKHTYKNFNNPVVVFSFMTEDLDRSVLQMREGIKPYYTIENGKLKFNQQPYIGNFKDFIGANPVTVKSYLWQKFLYSNANFLPSSLTARLTGELHNRKKVTALNEKILEATVNELRQSKTDFVFLIFNSMGDVMMPAENNWRMQFITNFVKQHDLQAIYTKDILPPMQNPDSTRLLQYYLKNDGHPNTAFIKLISKKIMSDVLTGNYEKNSTLQRYQNPYTYEHTFDSLCTTIEANTLEKKQVEINANEKNITYQQALQEYASWKWFEIMK